MQLTGIADIHLHTTHSDGTATVAQMLERAAEARVQVVAVTDHDTVAGALEARRMASQFGVDVIVGEEISTQEGHLLALFIDSYIAPRQSAATTIAAVHAQGGLCIAPHPYDWAVVSLGRYGLRERCATDWPFDAIEVFNASLAWPRHRCIRPSASPPVGRAIAATRGRSPSPPRWVCRQSAAAMPTQAPRSARALPALPAAPPAICITPSGQARLPMAARAGRSRSTPISRCAASDSAGCTARSSWRAPICRS